MATLKKQTIGDILIADLFDNALSVTDSESIPSLKLANALFEIGLKILFSNAFSFSPHFKSLSVKYS